MSLRIFSVKSEKAFSMVGGYKSKVDNDPIIVCVDSQFTGYPPKRTSVKVTYPKTESEAVKDLQKKLDNGLDDPANNWEVVYLVIPKDKVKDFEEFAQNLKKESGSFHWPSYADAGFDDYVGSKL